MSGPVRDLSRLLRPASIAVAGGVWARNVVGQLQKAGYQGDIWPVHPTSDEMEGLVCYRQLEDLPASPDATFLGVNRHLTISMVKQLSDMHAGGAVCFASGFGEVAEDGDAEGVELDQALLDAAGDMPILGPNCYGMINNLDGAQLWPDQHGCLRIDRGVAILTQSSNIAINLTMQQRGLPVAYVLTAGNQLQTGLAQLARGLLEDARVTSIGLHIEGVGDLRAFEAFALEARRRGVPVIAMKVGRSAHAKSASLSHTASIAGQDAGADALLKRLGIARIDTLPAFLETLKVLHGHGPLAGRAIGSMSCSGGEASLIADTALDYDLTFPELSQAQHQGLSDVLGPRVHLANPLDYHTYIWHDPAAMRRAYAAMMQNNLQAVILIIDFPRNDRCDAGDWLKALDAFILAAQDYQGLAMVCASLPDCLTEEIAIFCLERGVIAAAGLNEALAALEAAAFCHEARQTDAPASLVLPHENTSQAVLLSEAAAKDMLQDWGVKTPWRKTYRDMKALKESPPVAFCPLVLKGLGHAHKTETGLVALNLQNTAAVLNAANAMTHAEGFLVESMVTKTGLELLVGMTRDPAHGLLLTLSVGGVLSELMPGSQHLLLPVTEKDVDAALSALAIAPLFGGYRGKPPLNKAATIRAIMDLCEGAGRIADKIEEVEINPLIISPIGAVAVDALMRMYVESYTPTDL